MGGIVDSKEVGRRIRQFRQDAGLSQEALAELVGVSFQQVQKYESAECVNDFETLTMRI